MAISTEEALKMVESSMESENSQSSAPVEDSTASAQTTAADDKTSDVVNGEAKEETGSEPVEAKDEQRVGSTEGNKKPSDSKKSKKVYQQRVDSSFKRLKEQIKDKDKYIAELEAKLKRTSVLEEEDFNGDKKGYQQHLVNQALDERDLKEAKEWRENASQEAAFGEFNSALQEKADSIFGEGDEREHFSRLVGNGLDKFSECVNSRDPNGVVYEFLDDSKNAPLVLRTLMTNPEALKRVLDHKSPLAMMRELQTLENNIVIRRRLAAKKAVKSEAKPLPKLGSMVKSEGKCETDVYDDAWGAAYLKSHKSGRF